MGKEKPRTRMMMTRRKMKTRRMMRKTTGD
jgi:hypothetical protein